MVWKQIAGDEYGSRFKTYDRSRSADNEDFTCPRDAHGRDLKGYYDQHQAAGCTCALCKEAERAFRRIGMESTP
jgi:hypothetical protein